MHILGIKDIKELFAQHQTQFYDALGQNYLISPHGMASFVQLLPPTETIYEIGPGIGNITINYFQSFQHVILLEKDASKIPLLKEVLTKENNGTFPSWVEIVQTDALVYELPKNNDSYQIIGALPYNVAKRMVTEYLRLFPVPKQLTFILQREVADKYVAAVPDETFLSVSAQLFATPTRKDILKNSYFYPMPKVASRIITFTNFTATSAEDVVEKEKIATFIKQCFVQPRKKLRNVIYRPNASQTIQLLLEKRPQELTLEQWHILYEFFTQ